MTNLPALYSDVQVALKDSPFKMVQDGLEINTDKPISLSTYQELLETLLTLNTALGNGLSSIQLAMGDDLNAAEREHGEDFAQIIPDRAPSTLQTYKFVANSIKLPRRRGLSLSVLREIAYGVTYEDQEYYLDAAATDEMSVRDVRAMIHEDKDIEPVIMLRLTRDELAVIIDGEEQPPTLREKLLAAQSRF